MMENETADTDNLELFLGMFVALVVFQVVIFPLGILWYLAAAIVAGLAGTSAWVVWLMTTALIAWRSRGLADPRAKTSDSCSRIDLFRF